VVSRAEEAAKQFEDSISLNTVEAEEERKESQEEEVLPQQLEQFEQLARLLESCSPSASKKDLALAYGSILPLWTTLNSE